MEKLTIKELTIIGDALDVDVEYLKRLKKPNKIPTSYNKERIRIKCNSQDIFLIDSLCEKEIAKYIKHVGGVYDMNEYKITEYGKKLFNIELKKYLGTNKLTKKEQEYTCFIMWLRNNCTMKYSNLNGFYSNCFVFEGKSYDDIGIYNQYQLLQSKN